MAAFRVKMCVRNKTKNMLNSLINANINSSFIKRSFPTLSRCVHSGVKEKIEANDEAISPPVVRTEFTNRNPRNVEYEGKNKPRGYGTQFSRKDFYNK